MENEIYQKAAQEYGTPCYIFDLDTFRNRITAVRNLLGNVADVCFAMKANPFLAGAAAEAAGCLEVCSPGEFHICEKMGVPPEKVVLSGVSKEERDIAYVVEKYGDRPVYTVESMLHLKRLSRAARRNHTRLRVLLRVTSGNQFGLDEKLVKEIVASREDYSEIEFLGLQYFSGTQKKRIKVLSDEISYMDGLIRELEEEFGYENEVLEFGPGLYVEYFPRAGEDDGLSLIREFQECLLKMRYRGKTVLELGRYLAASCGTYLTSVVDQKVNGGTGYCIVDGGIHQVNYFGQTMAMKIPRYGRMNAAGELQKTEGEACWHVCGSLCTINDIIVKNLPLGDVVPGDILLFENTGAYSVTEGMALFLSRDLPKVLTFDRARGLRLVRDRFETYTLIGGY